MKTLLLIFICLGILSAHAQKLQKDTSVDCILKIAKGESHVVSITHTKTKIKNGKADTDNTLMYTATLTLVDSTEAERTFEWVYHIPSDATANKVLDALRPYYEDLTITYKTDEMGAFKELVNWQQVRDVFVKMMNVALPPEQNDSLNEALQKTMALFSNRQAVEAGFLKEIKLLHFPFGQQFSTKLYRERTSLPTPFAPQPIPAVITSRVTSIQPDYYVVTSTQVIKKNEAAPMLRQVFKKMGVADVIADKKVQEVLASLQISDESSFTLSRKNNLPLKTIFKRTAGTTGATQTETYLLEVK